MNRQKFDIILIYSLLLIGFISGGITSIIGVVYAYIRRRAVRGTVYEREYSDSILIFWILFVISFLPLILVLFFFGFGLIAIIGTALGLGFLTNLWMVL